MGGDCRGWNSYAGGHVGGVDIGWIEVSMKLILIVLLFGLWMTRGAMAEESASRTMAETVIRQWPAGVISTTRHPGVWGHEEGVVLDGMAAEWHATADGRDFHYIKDAVDKYVTDEGTIKGYPMDGHALDDIELGRAVLLVYRVTQEARYYKAAKFLHEQLAVQPRMLSGVYVHKEVGANQVWLDGSYMAEPFRAAYAATFREPGDFDDIAKQMLSMDAKMRDGRTGLMKQGWDESLREAWADKATGLSAEAWSRAMGWYAMALVDVLDWFPQDSADHDAQRRALVEALNRSAAAAVKFQDAKTGLWWLVMDKGARRGNYVEASASCMLVYALAKGVRMGYLPQSDEESARRGWDGVKKTFVAAGEDGPMVLNGTVITGRLGGSPYRSGTFEDYVVEKTRVNDAKGVGPFLMAGSEMEQAGTEALGQGKTVLVDAWFNSQTRKNAAGQTELFHYKWDDEANSGFSFFGRAFQRFGVRLATEVSAPTAEDLKKVQVYVLASPDIAVKNPTPHFMDGASGDVIEAWVKAGGVLILMENDVANSEFEHFNTLSERFGIHFNAVLRNHVVGDDFASGRLMIPAGTGVFAQAHVAYMKDTCSIAVRERARAVVTDKGDAMIAVSRHGKGVVLAVVDPWVYNEYTDRRNDLPEEYDTFAAAIDLAGWAVRVAR
jgi:unsaturated rhamnogalacturonyl hydrolase